MELHALDKNLAMIDSVEYKSLIWISRFNRVGACEVYAPATARNLKSLKTGNYLYRAGYDNPDNDSACRIVDVRINDNPDDGAFITAIGFDAKHLLDSRVNVTMQIFSSDQTGADLEQFIWRQLTQSGAQRELKKPNGYSLMVLPGDASDITGEVSQSVLGLSLGEMCRQICGSLDIGYKFYITESTDGDAPTPDRLPAFFFRLVAGHDRRDSVVFSREKKNIGNTQYEHDIRELGTVCYIQNPDVRYTASVLGSASGTDRVEKFLLTPVTDIMDYGNIKDALAGTWSLQQSGDNVTLLAQDLLVPILSPWQLTRLQAWTPGDTTTQPGFYHVAGPVAIATASDVQVAAVTDDTSFTVISPMYDYLQLCAGVEYMRDFLERETLDVEMLNSAYAFGVDYHLGDIVTVKANGTETAAQILEVLECWDENGYHLEPRTSYSDIATE